MYKEYHTFWFRFFGRQYWLCLHNHLFSGVHKQLFRGRTVGLTGYVLNVPFVSIGRCVKD